MHCPNLKRGITVSIFMIHILSDKSDVTWLFVCLGIKIVATLGFLMPRNQPGEVTLKSS